jgi:hypothetical protein
MQTRKQCDARGGFTLSYRKDREIEELETLASGVTEVSPLFCMSLIPRQMSQSTALLLKRRELQDVNEGLEFMKSEFARRMLACDEQQAAYELKAASRREQVSHYTAFLLDLDAKTLRAETKLVSENRLADQYSRQIDRLEGQLVEDQESCAALQRAAGQMGKYRAFLDLLLERCPGEFEEIGDVLNRHDTLESVRRDLQTESAQAEAQVRPSPLDVP